MSTCNRTSSDNQRHCNILKLQLDRLLRLLRQFERDQVSQGHTCECPPYGHEKPNPTDCKIQKLQQFVKLAAQSSTLLKRMISLPQEGAQGQIGFILTWLCCMIQRQLLKVLWTSPHTICLQVALYCHGLGSDAQSLSRLLRWIWGCHHLPSQGFPTMLSDPVLRYHKMSRANAGNGSSRSHWKSAVHIVAQSTAFPPTWAIHVCSFQRRPCRQKWLSGFSFWIQSTIFHRLLHF